MTINSLKDLLFAVTHKKTIDNIYLSPSFEHELNQLSFSKQGQSYELIVKIYLMYFTYQGNRFNLRKYKAPYTSINRISDIESGRGNEELSRPDFILFNETTKTFTLGQAKLNKCGKKSMDCEAIESYQNKVLGNLPIEIMLCSTDLSNMKLKNKVPVSYYIERGQVEYMYETLVRYLKDNNNTFKKLEDEKRHYITIKDPIQHYLIEEIKKIYRVYERDGKVYLHAIMRTGKSYIFAILASYYGSNKIIVITHYPTDTFDQFKDIIETSIQYKDHKVFLSSVSDLHDIKKCDKYVLIVSAQKIKINVKWKEFFATEKFDFVAFDEVHYGLTSPETVKILNNLDSKKYLYMSGTMEILKSNGKITPELLVEWSYIDTQLCKTDQNSKIKQYMSLYNFTKDKFSENLYPKLNIARVKLDRAKRQLLKNKENHESPMRELYFDEVALEQLLLYLFGSKFDISLNERFQLLGNIPLPLTVIKEKAMLAWYCPNKKCQDKLQKAIVSFINKYPESRLSKAGYIPKVFNCNPKNEDGKLNKEIKILEQDGNNYILILCSQGTTGITYAKLPVVIIGADIKSVTKYLQVSFRTMSPMEEEYERWVYDLSIGHQFINNIEAVLQNMDPTRTYTRKQLFEFVNITDGFERINEENFIKMINEEYSSKPHLILTNIAEQLDDVDLFSLLSIDKEATGTLSPSTFLIGQKGLNNSYNKNSSKQQNNSRANRDKTNILLRRYFLHLLLKYSIVYISDNKLDLKKLLENIEKNPEIFNENCVYNGKKYTFSQLYILFSKCVENLNTKQNFDAAIIKLRQIITNDENLSDILKIDTISKKEFSEVFTPKELVDEMLDSLPLKYWSQKNYKWLDNCCGIGTFLCGLVKRLKKYHTSEEVASMIYGVDIQSVNVEICREIMILLLGEEHREQIHKNIVCADSLLFGYWNIQFDVVVGNPPCNDSVYVAFLNKSVEISNNVLYITPSKWRVKNQNGIDIFRKNMILNYGLVLIQEHGFIREFAKNCKGGFNYVLLSKGYSELVKCNGKEKNLKEMLNNIGCIDLEIENDVLEQLIPQHKSNIHIGDCLLGRHSSHLAHIKKWKVIIPYYHGEGGKKDIPLLKNALTSWKIVEPNVPIEKNHVAFAAETKEQIIKLKEYLHSDIICERICLLKITPDITKEIFRFVPIPSFLSNKPLIPDHDKINELLGFSIG